MELQDIVRRLRMGQSIKAIKRETGKHRRVIRRLLLLAEQEGWLDEQDDVPSEQQLRSFPPGGARRGHVRNCCFLGAFPPAGGRSWHARNNGVYCMRDRMAREEAVESLV